LANLTILAILDKIGFVNEYHSLTNRKRGNKMAIKKLCGFCYKNTAYISKHGIPAMCDECIALNWKVAK
jgi:hypothetical protein